MAGGLNLLILHTMMMKHLATSSVRQPVEPPSIPAWAVFAWPTVLWQASHPQGCRFLHLGTRVTSVGQPACAGQTLWGDSEAEPAAGLAWDWIELTHGIVAMADPMAVITNVRLIGPAGEVLTASEAAPHLNELVHALPWQNEVQRAIQKLGLH